MKIINLYAENLKRLTAVQIEPDGNLVQITGRNGQGKTSVLDAIWWALDGTKNVQTTPIRKGEERAIVRLDLGEIKITRRFNAQEDGGYTTSITVENGEGARFSSPQTMLDKLLGELTFDPLAFTRMKDADQVMALRSLVPDFDFDQADADNKRDFAERTEANRRAKDARTQAAAIDLPDEVPQRVVFSEISTEWNEAHLHNQKVDEEMQRRADLNEEKQRIELQIGELQARVAQIDAEFSHSPAVPDRIDTDAIRARMDEAEETNRLADAGDRHSQLITIAKEAEVKSAQLTADMDHRKAKARKAIANADMPVSGLSIDEGAVHLDGVPFNQASDAQQLQASIGIAMALNPKLKVIRVRDGSLLDDEAMKTLAAMAEDHDYQIWIERVDSTGTIGFVLEDGHVKGQDIQVGENPRAAAESSQPAHKPGASLFDSDKV